MSRISNMIFLTIVAAAAIVLAGCGGGGGQPADDPGTIGTASVSGTVYAPDTSGTAQVEATQADTDGEPVPNCPVEVLTEPDGEQLASGTTDETGEYEFHGLPADVPVTVEAHVPDVGQLMSRVRLRAGNSRADVNADSTLAAWCARLARAEGPEGGEEEQPGPEDEETADEVAEECHRFREQHGPPSRAGQAAPPDFANAGEVREAARSLLGATAGEALEEAVASRDEDDAHRAVRLVIALLRARYDSRIDWPQPLVESLVGSLTTEATSVEAAAEALGQVREQDVTADMVQRLLQHLREGFGIGEVDRAPEVVEVVAAVSVATGDLEVLRIENAEGLGALANALMTD